ncbi:MAG: hypothetical protein OXU66_11570 [Gammaproteobacteria bacterium]|nr:hypothetical protein [Gammaproteobacteria bacterium]MDD9896685.1 hypothetical protein [Gammaproteobacteria bacterium]MDD9959568.1 hypothetical protein [Gammaproteobacteria bacterium]
MNRLERQSAKSNSGSRRTSFWVLNAYICFKKAKRYLPPVVRALLGLLLIFLGILGFLPVLGFWMIPLGIVVLATDIPPVSRWLRRKLQQYRVRD